jgi:lysophospholipase L1-like esterase
MSGEIMIGNHTLVFCAVGTNDLTNLALSPSMITCGIMNLLDAIYAANPAARLAFSGMLIRKKDIGTNLEYRRKLVNKMVKDECHKLGIHFFKSWKALMTGSSIKPRVYAKDGLHLSRRGARCLYKRIEGNIKTMAGLMRL